MLQNCCKTATEKSKMNPKNLETFVSTQTEHKIFPLMINFWTKQDHDLANMKDIVVKYKIYTSSWHKLIKGLIRNESIITDLNNVTYFLIYVSTVLVKYSQKNKLS